MMLTDGIDAAEGKSIGLVTGAPEKVAAAGALAVAAGDGPFSPQLAA